MIDLKYKKYKKKILEFNRVTNFYLIEYQDRYKHTFRGRIVKQSNLNMKDMNIVKPKVDQRWQKSTSSNKLISKKTQNFC